MFDKADDFWDTYRKGRPQVPDSFFERIYHYHAQNGNDFGTVHDAGAGGGVHSTRLAERFEKVIVTDVSDLNIKAAESHLNGPNYEFKTARLEDTIDFSPASVDMVFASTMLHFADIPKALEAVAHQLKPGGTFAVPLMGASRFSDPQVHGQVMKIFNAGFDQFYQSSGQEMIASGAVNASGYDCVHLPETAFQPGSLRIRLNEYLTDTPGGGTIYYMMIPPRLRSAYPPTSRTPSTDKVVYEMDDDWSFRMDINAVRRMFESFPFSLETEEMKRLWAELEQIVENREVGGQWVVYLILATRK
jgi:SAM-dependent methyltransferase